MTHITATFEYDGADDLVEVEITGTYYAGSPPTWDCAGEPDSIEIVKVSIDGVDLDTLPREEQDQWWAAHEQAVIDALTAAHQEGRDDALIAEYEDRDYAGGW